MFRVNKKVSWLISGLSLYMFYLSVDQGQLVAGLIAKYGMSGMWMIWAGWLGTFVVPLAFAPLWQKLDFLTDNQFLLFRFPGKSGQFLHGFRAVYVGGLVVAFSICFHLMGFSRIVEVFFHITSTQSILLTGGILVLFSVKNVFDLKLKMDAVHALLFFSSMAILVYFLLDKSLQWEIWDRYFVKFPEKRNLFPSSEDQNAWFSFIVFVGIQWWSAYLFDGGGPEMARYTAVEGKRNAWLTGLVPIFISAIFGFIMVGHVVVVLGLNMHSSNPELQYVQTVFNVVPNALQPIVLLGFFGMFISTAESLMNWGGSFLTIDIYKGYLNPEVSGSHLRFYSLMSMVFLSVLATVFALNISSLEELVKITFSIASGVAPVYILRWIWYRINAWSQLSAMLSSAIFTLIYPYFHPYVSWNSFPIEESRVVFVTLLTTITWLVVTFITPNQSKNVSEKMLKIIGSKRHFIKQFAFAIFLGIVLLALIVFVWRLILK